MTLPVEIAGIGRLKTEEKWTYGLIDLAVQASSAALDQISTCTPSAVISANSLGGALGDQRNLATFVASRLGLQNTETLAVNTDEASGGSAIRLAVSLISAGLHETVLVVGAEKTSDTLPSRLESARATGLDAAREAGFGFGPTVAAGLGMRHYLDKNNLDQELFFHIPETAHYHGSQNRLAFFPWPLSLAQYKKAAPVAIPLTVCDQAPCCDGAAAIILKRSNTGSSNIRILGSNVSSSTTGITEPISKLILPAAENSTKQALQQANLSLNDLSCCELHDVNSFISALSIESAGLSKPGQALLKAKEGAFKKEGMMPLWTFGGLKSRGNAHGAGGIYQAVEATLQLQGNADGCQIPGAKTALIQCLGSFGAMAVTHILGQ